MATVHSGNGVKCSHSHGSTRVCQAGDNNCSLSHPQVDTPPASDKSESPADQPKSGDIDSTMTLLVAANILVCVIVVVALVVASVSFYRCTHKEYRRDVDTSNQFGSNSFDINSYTRHSEQAEQPKFPHAGDSGQLSVSQPRSPGPGSPSPTYRPDTPPRGLSDQRSGTPVRSPMDEQLQLATPPRPTLPEAIPPPTSRQQKSAPRDVTPPSRLRPTVSSPP